VWVPLPDNAELFGLEDCLWALKVAWEECFVFGIAEGMVAAPFSRASSYLTNSSVCRFGFGGTGENGAQGAELQLCWYCE
jgi:hypothetical protein